MDGWMDGWMDGCGRGQRLRQRHLTGGLVGSGSAQVIGGPRPGLRKDAREEGEEVTLTLTLTLPPNHNPPS